MAKHSNDEFPLEQGQRDTEIRRDTAVRGSMGAPASGEDEPKVTPETDVFIEQEGPTGEAENIRGALKDTRRKLGETVEKIGKRIKS